MQASPFYYHDLNTNNTKTIQNKKNSNPFNVDIIHLTLLLDY
jgi:hypothetical protein